MCNVICYDLFVSPGSATNSRVEPLARFSGQPSLQCHRSKLNIKYIILVFNQDDCLVGLEHACSQQATQCYVQQQYRTLTPDGQNGQAGAYFDDAARVPAISSRYSNT
jgi:hypothetical protein